MEVEKIFTGLTFAILLTMLVFAFIPNTNKKQIKDPIIIQDTSYNHIILDSIQYNIQYRDTIIYKLKLQWYEDIEESRNLSDSASVELFYKLLSE